MPGSSPPRPTNPSWRTASPPSPRAAWSGSTNYIKALNLVVKETYLGGFTPGITITIDAVAGQRTITYAP